MGMPIFDFECSRCSTIFEILVLKDTDAIQCPECGSESASKRPVSSFNCTGSQMNKRLRMESRDRMKSGGKMMKNAKWRKERIKIL
jgi:putative FmdB family regulatory protein